MKKAKILALIILILLFPAFFSCNVSMTKRGEDINRHIFPYMEFVSNGDKTCCSARIIAGARVLTVMVPKEATVEGNALPVKEFLGWANPDDSAGVKRIILESAATKIADDALNITSNLPFVECRQVPSGSVWTGLPTRRNEDGHLVWFAGNKYGRERNPG